MVLLYGVVYVGQSDQRGYWSCLGRGQGIIGRGRMECGGMCRGDGGDG